ncbi:serine hydrolase domain-containing protein [Candidatus Mycolicibacterium alkanivorans]|uniref:Beta-lactamase family protein n=1 Tax=Candidatus Mycolicibacterium alkanivorans TaxID=2954114 RepID=A0ABS9YY41_9MYCO|nr:serine hydrolase domain-containing protein [Candidatus Mycolicibacterium alkanivorans]MCI4676141.1 beta-lactamase family protein [Candidatus Mycolicibacterium alkanivorans]
MSLADNRTSIVQAVDAGLLAGAVTLVWQRGKVLQVSEVGYRDVEAKLPMRRDTIFRIASMTKPVTVAAAMTLVDEGRLALSDPVSRWLPELAHMRVLVDPMGPLERTVPAQRPITIDDLMTHRSGLAYMFSVLGPLSRAYGGVSLRQDQDHWLAEVATLPLVHQPGDRLTYSHATEVLGIALSRIEGKPLHRVLSERIFEPLGMTDTGFFISPDKRGRTATMYRLDELKGLQHDAMGPIPVTEPRFCQGGAGLLSTADDYLRFVRMLLGGGEIDGVRVLSDKSVQLMRSDQLTEGQKRHRFLGMPYWIGRGFGLNLSVVTDAPKSTQLFGPGSLGTFSWPGAYGTWWQADPSNESILIYLIQNYPNLTAAAAAVAVAGNTSLAELQSVQPRFVRRTYAALEE